MSSAILIPHEIVANVVVWNIAPIIAYLFRFDGFIHAEKLVGLGTQGRSDPEVHRGDRVRMNTEIVEVWLVS